MGINLSDEEFNGKCVFNQPIVALKGIVGPNHKPGEKSLDERVEALEIKAGFRDAPKPEPKPEPVKPVYPPMVVAPPQPPPPQPPPSRGPQATLAELAKKTVVDRVRQRIADRKSGK